MTLGFIGAGAVAQTSAGRVPRFGHKVLPGNGRGSQALAEVTGKPRQGASAGTRRQAAAARW